MLHKLEVTKKKEAQFPKIEPIFILHSYERTVNFRDTEIQEPSKII